MELEISLFRSINNMAHQVDALDSFMLLISHPNFWIIVACVIFVVGLRTKNERILSSLLVSLIALGVSDLISFEVIKPLVGRERPCWLLADVQLFNSRCGGSYGFTSNHAANAFAVWTVMARSYGLLSVPAQVALTLASAVSLSRVYLGVHFVGDIVGGAILGVTVASSLWVLGLSKTAGRVESVIKARFKPRP